MGEGWEKRTRIKDEERRVREGEKAWMRRKGFRRHGRKEGVFEGRTERCRCAWYSWMGARDLFQAKQSRMNEWMVMIKHHKTKKGPTECDKFGQGRWHGFL